MPIAKCFLGFLMLSDSDRVRGGQVAHDWRLGELTEGIHPRLL